jgi:hypothetical protein
MILNQRKTIVISEGIGSGGNANSFVVTVTVLYNGKTDPTGDTGKTVVPARSYAIHPKYFGEEGPRQATMDELARAESALIDISMRMTKPPFGSGIRDLAAIFSAEQSWGTSDFLLIGGEGHTLVTHEQIQPVVDAYRKGIKHRLTKHWR